MTCAARGRVRLLSGGKMRKLIFGRVLEVAPDVVLAKQPVRDLDIGALTHGHEHLLAARDRGAAMIAGANLFSVLGLITKGAFGLKFATLETPNRATPLISPGMAVADAFMASGETSGPKRNCTWARWFLARARWDGPLRFCRLR